MKTITLDFGGGTQYKKICEFMEKRGIRRVPSPGETIMNSWNSMSSRVTGYRTLYFSDDIPDKFITEVILVFG